MINNVTSIDELDFDKMSDGLIPVIVQDVNNLQVLMLGYMNREAYAKTIELEKVTFYSRTRKCLWTKGETSGNFLNICEISKDCDADTLLIKVVPVGNVCHTGSRSCFGGDDSIGFIRELQAVIQGRKAEMPEGSYTTHLFNKGVNKMAQKVGEEAVETVIEAIACNDERLLYEASDLIYHLLVLLISKGYSIADLEKELIVRHK
ncbi:MAG: bifunctional phosphoribosyl-AMP cyclohydrolase/phosphoribosyl-ATP diphosphatase HisIE [Rikenellaceae bacterium]